MLPYFRRDAKSVTKIQKEKWATLLLRFKRSSSWSDSQRKKAKQSGKKKAGDMSTTHESQFRQNLKWVPWLQKALLFFLCRSVLSQTFASMDTLGISLFLLWDPLPLSPLKHSVFIHQLCHSPSSPLRLWSFFFPCWDLYALGGQLHSLLFAFCSAYSSGILIPSRTWKPLIRFTGMPILTHGHLTQLALLVILGQRTFMRSCRAGQF